MKRRRTENLQRSRPAKRIYRKPVRRRLPSRNPRTGGFLGQEVKFFDTFVHDGVIASVGNMSGLEGDPATVLCLNAVSQGDGEQQRDGRKIGMKSIHINGYVQLQRDTGITTPSTPPVVMIALVLDTQTNGAQLNSENVYTNPSGQADLCGVPFRNLQYTDRFRVLGTKVMSFTSPSMASGSTTAAIRGSTVRHFKFNCDLNMTALFSGTTSVVGNVVDNSLHIIVGCTNDNMTPLLHYNSRLRFEG